ncbi:gamma-glutamyltransferase [Novosphingobium album (ex Liu et al. 2023)]|uniref:Glutathione hydrolase proenzyme n=1 Tax=Novosphingobium album (ex Liu et al. 2023) TaxID=3031130 RepID=A0ABT5WR36_9SPHN|nr:gamma-glutamyltransferase [Novosphingobium album (ex Liu et al. 2023)]MDE8651732.1 gamma-glutamyltransferase [Novosphingobium album (ex Liu et al. 2023)]
MLQRFLLGLAAPLALSACASVPAPPSASSPSLYDTGMVSAADPRAAEAGAEILRKGGSATDAAIATMLALTVVEPQSSGIGGGGFYVRGGADGAIETIDGRETAPAAATPRRFLGADGKPLPFRTAVIGGRSVGVPGNLALAAKAHAEHGKLAWAALFAPAIRLARDGWVLSQRGHDFLQRQPDTGAHDAAGKALFYDAAGVALPAGARVRNPALARTLETIARQGAGAFYQGPLGREIAGKVAAETPDDGRMSAADIAGYAAKERPPVCGVYRAYRICGMGPPSSGATTVLAILIQLEPFDMAALGPDSPVAWHLFAESQRLAYADRDLYLADPDFVPVPVQSLIDPEYLHARGRLIAPDRTLPQALPGRRDLARAPGFGPPENGTSHFVVVDRAGEAVSYTSTIESAFGSGIMAGGFYLNNELTDFSFVPEQNGAAVANGVWGGKRPRSSMAPTLVYGPDGKLVLVVGAAGGATIPVQVARALIGFIDWRLPIADALALPVLYSPGDTVTIEQGSKLEALIPALAKLGHAAIRKAELPLKTNAIAVKGRALDGAADPRSEGRAISQ